MKESLTTTLAEFVVRTASADIPPDVQEKTAHVVVDSIACALAACSMDLGKAAVRYAQHDASGEAGASIIGGPSGVQLEKAVFANAELINALDFDEVLLNWGHVAPYVLPPALALAEALERSGSALVRAVALGYDVGARVSAALEGSVRVDGTPPDLSASTPDVYGFSGNVFGAAAASAALLELSEEQTADALGIAGHLAPVATSIKWATTSPVPMTKYGCAGWIAQSGMTAALLASHGFSGDRTVFEGPFGFARMIGSATWRDEEVIRGLGERWWVRDSAFKPWPGCRFIHHPMEAVRLLMDEHGLTVEAVSALRVWLIPRAATSPIFGVRRPATVLDAQFSVPFLIAAAAHDRHGYPDVFSEATLRDEQVLKLAEAVEIYEDERVTELRYAAYGNDPVGPMEAQPTKVELDANGRTYATSVEHCLGDPWTERTRYSRSDVFDKFATCAHGALDQRQIETATGMLRRLEQLDSVKPLCRSLASLS